MQKKHMEVGKQRRHGGGGQMKRMKTFAGRGVKIVKIEDVIHAVVKNLLYLCWHCQKSKQSVTNRGDPYFRMDSVLNMSFLLLAISGKSFLKVEVCNT